MTVKPDSDYLLWGVTVTLNVVRFVFVAPWTYAACWGMMAVPLGAHPLVWWQVLALRITLYWADYSSMRFHIEDEHGDKRGEVTEVKAFGRTGAQYFGLALVYGIAWLFVWLGWPGETK
jgi:hypothetical protein